MAGITSAVVGAGAGLYSSRKASKEASKASKDASRAQASSEQASLDYLKEQDAQPQFFREQALQQLGGYYGLPGYEGKTQIPGIGTFADSANRKDYTQQVMSDPLYQRSLQQGEESILRNQAMTGGLRSGNTQSALADNAQGLMLSMAGAEEARDESRRAEMLGGLTGFSNLPSYAPQIAQGTAGIGRTLGQGIMGAGQAKSQFYSGLGSGLMGIGGSMLGMPQAPASPASPVGSTANFAPKSNPYDTGFGGFGF